MKNRTIQSCLKFAASKLDNHPYFIKKADGSLKPGKFLHFSFVVQGTTILGWGWNHHGDSPDGFGYRGCTIHAEVHAYDRARNKIDPTSSFEVLNIRFNRVGQYNLSKPCPCCAAFLKTVGCKNIYFTTDCGIASLKL
jgi:tRNA(Arg) A34 adenosine deaminase TadA